MRYLGLCWTARPPKPGLSALDRASIAVSVLSAVATVPVWGLAWQLDEMLYGRALRDTPVVAPLFEISAGRSGSTQLARYLEEDPHLVAPTLLQSMFPFLWLWRLAPVTVGRLFTREQVRERIGKLLPPEMIERHEADPFRTDTFDGSFYTAHLNHLAPVLGPEAIVADFGFATIAEHNRELWGGAFVELIDRVARKTLLAAGPAADGRPRRFFVKGHFLCAADALERRYPDARFLTMIREPSPRLQSAINYLRVNPFEPGPVPWAWWSAALVVTEADYCRKEQAWFSRTDGATRCVVRFSAYVRDLPGTMATVYRECLDTPELPAFVPRTHPARERTNYRVDRTLAQVGVDGMAFDDSLSAYVAWCRMTQEPAT